MCGLRFDEVACCLLDSKTVMAIVSVPTGLSHASLRPPSYITPRKLGCYTVKVKGMKSGLVWSHCYILRVGDCQDITGQ